MDGVVPLNPVSAVSDRSRPRPVVLLLVDGWGIAPAGEGNAISAARTPVFLEMTKEYPVAVLKPVGRDWNGRYLNLGAGADLSGSEERPLTLSSIVSAAGFRQLKITDSERFAALTNFFNGGREEKALGEEWKIVSTATADPDAKIKGDFRESAKALLKAIKSASVPDLIIVSLPYLDLVSYQAAGRVALVTKAVESLDKSLGVLKLAVEAQGGLLIISAAGGNAEQVFNLRTEEIDRGLTANPVPLLIVGNEFKGKSIGSSDAPDNDLSLLAPAGTLADIAPTILAIMGLDQPPAMSGKNLLA